MKYILTTFFLLIIFHSSGQLEITGDVCDNTPIYDFTYENYTFGNHGYGFWIFRNGSTIYGEEVIYDYVAVYNLNFVSDPVGFIIKVDDGVYDTYTAGTSWAFFT